MRSGSIAAILVLTLSTIALGADVLKKTAEGQPPLKSINVLSFAPNGVLLVGDGAGSQVIAIDTGDVSGKQSAPPKIEGFDAKAAGRLGTKADGIEIIDVAVNPASGTPYVAVRKQDDKSYVLLTIDGEGAINEFELDEVKYARIQLSAGNDKIRNITDVAWADDRVIAAGRSNETFASKIFSINAPLVHDATSDVYSAETYHVSHSRWETKAPMSVVIPLKQGDKTYVVGAFSCTPIVKYPLDSVQPGGEIKGSSVIELGSGNRPIDMFVYTKGGKQFVLANTFRFHHDRRPFGPSPYWAVKFEQNLLTQDKFVNKEAVRRLKGNYEPAVDSIQMVDAFHGVMQMDKLGDAQALVLRKMETGIDLDVVALP